MTRIILLLALMLFPVGTTLAQIYKWVDEDGNVHYGDCPPPECKSKQIETAPGPSEEDIQRSRERTERLIREQKQREEARKLEREMKRKEMKQRKAVIKKRCKVFRSRLFLLKQPGVITLTDDEGNMMRPTDVERERMINDLEVYIRKYCE